MRRLFTTQKPLAAGISEDALRLGVCSGEWRRVRHGVYVVGSEPPSELECAVADVLACGGVASGHLAGVLHDLDGVELDARPVRRRALPPERTTVINGIPCTDGLQTLIDIAATVSDVTWEQALESALRFAVFTTVWLHELDRTRNDPLAVEGVVFVGRSRVVTPMCSRRS